MDDGGNAQNQSSSSSSTRMGMNVRWRKADVEPSEDVERGDEDAGFLVKIKTANGKRNRESARMFGQVRLAGFPDCQQGAQAIVGLRPLRRVVPTTCDSD